MGKKIILKIAKIISFFWLLMPSKLRRFIFTSFFILESRDNIPSKSIENLFLIKDKLDWIITVCDNANETCPIVSSSTQIKHIGFDDPPKLAKKIKDDGGSEKEQIEPYRRVRDEIRVFVEKLPNILK